MHRSSGDVGNPLPPPTGFKAVIRKLGPGLIVSGSIVGSGELIATTTLGASVGFAALWLILLSCVIKVVVQEELGRYCISSGETTFQALDRVPGPRWRVSWVVWCWLLMLTGVSFQQGGIIGGVAQVCSLAFPFFDTPVWTVLVALLAVVVLLRGIYSHIERTCTFLVSGFTFITISCVVALFWTSYSISWENLVEGFSFTLPSGGLAVAFAAFGITGVGATELVYYPYWCLEKGYARFVGEKDGTAAWLERARGWIRVMQIDALLAMVLYTLATIAFYLLGAAVLYGEGRIPAGYEMVRILSSMYTATLGNWAFALFLLGAFFVLFSTTYSATASTSRVLVDFLNLVGLIRLPDKKQHLVWWRWIVVGLISLYTFWFLLLGVPVVMVIIGGIAQACMLPVLGFSTIYLRYRATDRLLRPSLMIDLLLWLTSTAMLLFAVYTLIARLS
jgi:manganese transport protein